MKIITDAASVVAHGLKKAKRGRNPSMSFLEIKNPRKALEKAKFYWNLIKDFIDSKKSPESKLNSILFVLDRHISQVKSSGISDFVVRIKNQKGDLRRGQIDFCLVTEDGKFFDLDFFHKHKDHFRVTLSYYNHAKSNSIRYRLSDLRGDVLDINSDIKLVYVILFSPKMNLANVFSLNQFAEIHISFNSSDVESCEDIEDDIDQAEKWAEKQEEIRWKDINNRRGRGQTVHICPACSYEWNNHYCHYCGWPN